MRRTSLMMDEEVLARLSWIAQRKGETTSKVIREALAEYVVTHRPQGAGPLQGLIGLMEDEQEASLAENSEVLVAEAILARLQEDLEPLEDGR